MPDTDSKHTRTAILVLGMHRSGTSLLSGLIAEAGVALGPSLMPAAPDNPKGFWENQRIVDLHEKVLNQFGQSWSSWEPLPQDWQQAADVQTLRRELQQIVAQEFADESVFCVKDPRLCRLLPMWRDLCDDIGTALHCVLISRPLEEVAASLQTRDGLGGAHADALWLRYSLDMLENSEGLPLVRTSYSSLLEDPAASLEAISKQIGMPLDVSDSELPDTSLRHHQRPEGEPGALWAEELLAHLEDADAALHPRFDELVTPLVNRLALAEREFNEALVKPEQLGSELLETARENLLFEQAEDARRYATSMEQELETGRAYIEDMERELKNREEYVTSLESELKLKEEESASFIQSLQAALEQKEADLATAVAGHAEAVAAKDEYAQSLLKELEDTQHRLEEELQRFRYLRKMSELLPGNKEQA